MCFVVESERPLKYETMRPVSAAISVKHRPPAPATGGTRRRVQSAAAARRPQPDHVTVPDHVTAGAPTTTPDNSDVEDREGDNSGQGAAAWIATDAPDDWKKNGKIRKRGGGVERRRTRGLECAGGLEEDVEKTKMMEMRFKQQVMRLQQQLSLTGDGYVMPH